jgi:hypothetical protein
MCSFPSLDLKRMKHIYKSLVRIMCCQPRGYHYMQYNDDLNIHDNVLFDMRNVNFHPFESTSTEHPLPSYDSKEWRDCHLFESSD